MHLIMVFGPRSRLGARVLDLRQRPVRVALAIMLSLFVFSLVGLGVSIGDWWARRVMFKSEITEDFHVISREIVEYQKRQDGQVARESLNAMSDSIARVSKVIGEPYPQTAFILNSQQQDAHESDEVDALHADQETPVSATLSIDDMQKRIARIEQKVAAEKSERWKDLREWFGFAATTIASIGGVIFLFRQDRRQTKQFEEGRATSEG